MLKHFETTGIILLWCLVIAGLWGVLKFTINFHLKLGSSKRSVLFLPSMVLAPVFILIAFRSMRWNLFYPLSLEASLWDLLKSGVVPAVVLLIASGVFKTLSKNIAEETAAWKEKLFTRVAHAYGMSESKQIRKLVLFKSYSDAFSQCLPWLFGELIICEVLFNAPGLGLEAWNNAKLRDFSSLSLNVASIAILYISCLYLTSSINSWIGKRLSSYA